MSQDRINPNEARHQNVLTSAQARQHFIADAIAAIRAALPALEMAAASMEVNGQQQLDNAFSPSIIGVLYPTARASITVTHFDGKRTPAMQIGMRDDRSHVELVLCARDSVTDNEAGVRLIFDPATGGVTAVRDRDRF